MYFNAEAQARIPRRFHFALAPGGVLFLGKAAMLLGHSSLFTPSDVRHRVFRKSANGVPLPGEAGVLRAAGPTNGPPPLAAQRLREEAMLAEPLPHVVVSGDGRVAAVSRQAEVLFGVSARDVGRPFRDLELSFRPVELRGYMEQAQIDRRSVRVRDVEMLRGSDQMHLDIQVTPLVDRDGAPLGRVDRLLGHISAPPPAHAAGAGEPPAGDGLRGAPVHERRAADDERRDARPQRSAR
jgi:two-component system CheB/CheR fusion protein